jgi:hypothetical protein
LRLCDLVVSHILAGAAGHAVQGQFIVDVGAEGHGDTFKESNYSALHQNRLGCRCEERSLRRSNPQAVKPA